MRKIFWGFPAIFLIAWVAWPYLTLYQLNQAVTDQDTKALDRLVDWDSVGMHLSNDLEGMFDDQRGDGSDDMTEGLVDILINSFTDLMIVPVVNFYTTPRGLSYLLNTQNIIDNPMDVFDDDFPNGETWYDHISFAFFSSPVTFKARLQYPEESTKNDMSDTDMTLVLHFTGFRWQLGRIELPAVE